MNLSRRDFVKAISIAMAGLSVPHMGCSNKAGTDNQKSPPNFIIIFTDDQGYGDLGVFGATDIATPNIDRMAQQGVTFTSFYVGSPVCTPSRASLLTGCYSGRVGLQQGVLFPNDKKGLNPDEVTIADLLKEKGYSTACIGKWHLGRPSEFLPTKQGFDSYFGVPYSNDMNPKHPMSEIMGGFPPLPLMRNEEVIESPVDQSTLTGRYTEEAISFIKQNKNNPFFIYLAHSMPHYPCHSSYSFTDSSKRGDYGDSVQEIDNGVGRIIETLQNLGIDENTLVVFTSDNGPWKSAQEVNFINMGGDGTTGSALPLSGWKGQTLEGGMRVPTVMRWPEYLPADIRCSELACTLDLLPTIAGLVNADLPGDRVIDGKNISKLMKNPSSGSPHDYFYYYSNVTKNLNAVRDSQGFKLHLWADPEGYGKESYEVKELYYLPDDIGEKDNIYASRPDVVKRLKEAAMAFDADLLKKLRPPGQIQ
jgi:arylsulfatase A-like enzyme